MNKIVLFFVVIASGLCAVKVHFTQDPYTTNLNVTWDDRRQIFKTFDAKPGPHSMDWTISWWDPNDNQFHSYTTTSGVSLDPNMESVTFHFAQNTMQPTIKWKN
jgi:hypothetical protein